MLKIQREGSEWGVEEDVLAMIANRYGQARVDRLNDACRWIELSSRNDLDRYASFRNRVAKACQSVQDLRGILEFTKRIYVRSGNDSGRTTLNFSQKKVEGFV